MQYISTNESARPVTFSQAAKQGLAPDGGLYMPDSWPQMSSSFLESLSQKSLKEIGYAVSQLFMDEIDDALLRKIIDDALSFNAPLFHLNEQVSVLELFHGPSLAFKDFGARFMARLFSTFQQEAGQELIILAATSGDTGSAVAQGFKGVKGVQVCLLYPSGKVSHIQEQQLTTVGGNVKALEIEGTFDDCQKLVKQAFSDSSLRDTLRLSSANSINIARLLPQMFYYFHAAGQLGSKGAPIFSVPSGNFGNLTAGLFAQESGLPVTGFIAATNANDIVPHYLHTGKFTPKSSKRTLSNAMDVGHPSNFARISHLFNNDHDKIRQQLWGASFTDNETKKAIEEVFRRNNYLMDPHTAIGYLAVKKYKTTAGAYFNEDDEPPFVILSTAHPAKFGDVIEPVIDEEVPVPARLAACMDKEKQSIPMLPAYGQLKQWLINTYRE